MARVVRAAGAVGLAVVLFALGALGLGRTIRGEAPPAATSDGASQPLLTSPVIAAGSLSGLIEQLQERLRVQPDDWRALASLGLAYVQQARITADPAYYPKAEEALERSLALNPEANFDAVLGLGTLALARHDFHGALGFGEQARGLNPHNATVYGVIGDAQVELGRYDAAFATFQTMVDTRPNLASYARASYARELQGDVEGATQAMELALGVAGTPIDAAWASHQLGELSFNAGDLNRAEEYFTRGTQLAPDFIPAHAGLAKVAAAGGNTAEAIRGYRFVTDRYPATEYVIALGDLYMATGQEDLAGREYELVGVQEKLAGANGVNTDLEFALFHADRGTDLDAALARARAEYERRQSVHVADALAWTLFANGQYEEAMTLAEEALRPGYRNASFSFHAGMIAFELGDWTAAREHLEQALDINPDFSVLQAPVAERTLARLRGGS
jgi:tetratricopeptide (TPR) repeat protein